jgi:hypothetical protein
MVEEKTEREIETLTQDRIGWKIFVSSLCAPGHEKG